MQYIQSSIGDPATTEILKWYHDHKSRTLDYPCCKMILCPSERKDSPSNSIYRKLCYCFCYEADEIDDGYIVRDYMMSRLSTAIDHINIIPWVVKSDIIGYNNSIESNNSRKKSRSMCNMLIGFLVMIALAIVTVGLMTDIPIMIAIGCVLELAIMLYLCCRRDFPGSVPLHYDIRRFIGKSIQEQVGIHNGHINDSIIDIICDYDNTETITVVQRQIPDEPFYRKILLWIENCMDAIYKIVSCCWSRYNCSLPMLLLPAALIVFIFAITGGGLAWWIAFGVVWAIIVLTFLCGIVYAYSASPWQMDR